MAAGVMESRGTLMFRLEQLLGTLVSTVKIAGKNNHSSTHVMAETTVAGLLNRVYGWALENANVRRQNYPGVDLIDVDRRIAVQVTSERTVQKVQETLKKVAGLEESFDRLILLLLTDEAPTKGMKESAGPMETWNLSDVFRVAKELETDRLAQITAYMEAELGRMTRPHLELPPVSALQATGFVGREEELEEIGKRFADGDKQVVLTGLGGMGKTELAVEYGRKHGSACFVRFDTDFTRTLASMAKGIRPPLTKEELQLDDGSLCQRVLDVLEQSTEEDLLIIDNADSPTGTLADLLRDPVYEAIRALPLRRLVTTRSYAPRAIEVRPMEAQPLFQIFENHGAELTEREMRDLIDAVNGHTLTVDLIARTLNGRGWRRVTAEDMLTALRERTLASRKYQKIASDYSQSRSQAQIYGHLSVVFDMSGMSGEGQQVMRCASLLPDGGMDAELFGNALQEEEQEALDTLLGQGWLEVRHDLLTIHPVIRLVCREELKPTEETCGGFLEALWEQLRYDEYDRVKFAQLAEVFETAMEIDGAPQTKAEWLNYSGRLWGELMESRRCAALYDAHIPVLEPQLPDHLVLAAAYNNIGYAYGDLRDHKKALEYLLKALAICEKILPPDHRDLALSYNNVGMTYGNLGDHQKASEYKLKALAIFEKVLPPDHPDLALSYNNVGGIYGDLGDHKKELEYMIKALAIWEEALPPDHPNLATSYNNVGSTYGDLGDHNKALEYDLKALAIREKVLPPDHPALAQSYNIAGGTYGALGNHNKALEYKLKALAIREKVLPPDHPDLARSYNDVGLTYGDLGDHNKALEYTLKALAIREKVLPPDHPDIAQSYNNMGSAYRSMDNHKKSLEYVLKALAICEKALSPDHPDLAIPCNNLAWTYYEMGKYETALEYMRRAAGIAEHSLPEGHPNRVKFRRWVNDFEVTVKMQQDILSKLQGFGPTSSLFPFGKK